MTPRINPFFPKNYFLYLKYKTMDKLFATSTTQIAIRFDYKGEMTLETLQEKFDGAPFMCFYLMALEEATNKHAQGYISVTSVDKKLENIRRWLKKEFNIPTVTDSNGKVLYAYAISKVKNLDDYKKYVIKDGQFVSRGIDVEELRKLTLISYPKKKQFQKELDELEIRYLDSNMENSQYLFEFMKLKANYRQVINTNYAKQRLIMLIARKDDNRLKRIAQSLADEVQFLER